MEWLFCGANIAAEFISRWANCSSITFELYVTESMKTGLLA